MRWDDRDDDPFADIFRQIERMMEGMAGGDAFESTAGFGADTHFSVYEEEDSVRVVGDLAGVDKTDIDIKCDGRYLTVEAATDTEGVRERLQLPVRVDEHSANATFNNGILEITFDRVGDSANIHLG